MLEKRGNLNGVLSDGGSLTIEPRESESKPELDRFCEAMIAIRGEIAAMEKGGADRSDNVLKNAPHTVGHALADAWTHPYTREQAVFPLAWVRAAKFWPSVGRVNAAFEGQEPHLRLSAHRILRLMKYPERPGLP